MHRPGFAVRLLLWGFGLLALTGCAGKFTRENYARVTLGEHTRADVRELLGKPAKQAGPSDEEWFYEDARRGYSARVYFAPSGTVAGKQWSEAEGR